MADTRLVNEVLCCYILHFASSGWGGTVHIFFGLERVCGFTGRSCGLVFPVAEILPFRRTFSIHVSAVAFTHPDTDTQKMRKLSGGRTRKHRMVEGFRAWP